MASTRIEKVPDTKAVAAVPHPRKRRRKDAAPYGRSVRSVFEDVCKEREIHAELGSEAHKTLDSIVQRIVRVLTDEAKEVLDHNNRGHALKKVTIGVPEATAALAIALGKSNLHADAQHRGMNALVRYNASKAKTSE